MAATRNMGAEYTETEVRDTHAFFKSLPTYRIEEDSIASSDIPEFVEKMRWGKTPEQVQGYIDHWNTYFKGRAPWPYVEKYLRTVHETRLLIFQYVDAIDKNKDGFISRNEFCDVLRLAKKHDPDFKEVFFEEFLKHADTDADGKVSRAECEEWLLKKLQK